VYGDVLAACREQGAGFMLQRLESGLAELDKLAGPPPKNAPSTGVALPNANWSVRQPLAGRLRLIPANKNIRDLLSVRAGDAEHVIYLMESRATVVELMTWPDKNSDVVSAGGGPNSEEMNFAQSECRPYVNGAAQYFEVLKRLNGRNVVLLPTDTMPAPRAKSADVDVESYLPVEDDSLSPVEYINRVVIHSTNRVMAYAFLAWGLEGSESGQEACEALKRVLTGEQYRRRVEEGRDIPPKDYPRGYKLRTTSEFIRALARFASAREEKRFDYALKVAGVIPYAPLSRLLKGALAEEKGEPRRLSSFRKT
jgi:hypothetical protein